MPQDRPDCPFVLNEPAALAPRQLPPPQPPAPSLCLGEESAAALPALAGLTEEVAAGLALYRQLARRVGRSPLFRELATAKAGHLARLEAAAYLIGGQPPLPPPRAALPAGGLAPLLRSRFHAEQALVLRLLTAAEGTGDLCLRELYRDLATQTQALADRLRRRLEALLGG